MNERRPLFTKGYNRYTFTPLKIEFEYEPRLYSIYLEVIVLGFGFYISCSYNKESLINKLSK